METIRGRIESVKEESGTSRTGDLYTRWVFVIDGKNYSTFDEKIGKSFKAGDYVEMTGERKGKYFNMTNMSACDGKVAQNGSNEEFDTAKPGETGDQNRRIARMNALTNAVNLRQIEEIDIIETARNFVDFIYKG